ncbi:MAG: hypothetical protein Q9195_002326 [Heterodermia aff. obscurata]
MATSTPKSAGKSSLEKKSQDPNPPTFASFSPASTFASPTTRQRSTILVNRKSPLLVATPPSVTRALAFSHPFVLPANKLAGLLSWSSGDPWESFLLVAAFWAIVLYGDTVITWTGPILAVVVLILGMYSRRYSPLSSTGWTGEKQKGHEKKTSEGSSMRHQKSLDEIIDTLVTMTSRCNMLLEPFMQLTDYLSTQRTATSATTRPALTTLFIRILLVTPVWVIMTISPIRLITTRRVVLAVGTLFLTWHSRPARVSRIILWRSNTLRRLASLITGLELSKTRPPPSTGDVPPPLPPRTQNQHDVANAFAGRGRVQSSGVRFTFVVFENQRRWLGLGWTSSLFSYERAAWTDEHLNPSDPKEKFALPEVDNKSAEWRWAPGSEWQVEGSGKSTASVENDGWIYYDNKWNDGRRGQDGWGRYTRRRKWYRDAELVEVVAEPELDSSQATLVPTSGADSSSEVTGVSKDTDDSSSSQARKRGWFRKSSKSSAQSSGYAISTTLSSDDEPDHRFSTSQERDGDWGVGDDLKMGLG